MKRYAAILFVFIFAFQSVSKACTTFFLQKDGRMVFGRNYDWVTSTGLVNTNSRGVVKTSLPPTGGKTFSWSSRYGSITFNQYGKEFPTGGMNEKGLVVELMWLNDSEFPAPDKRPAISVLQWIQYQLDNCSTIEEVIATDSKIRIVSDGTPQHYLIADGNGKVATIEFLNGRMVVHTGKDLPFAVLANSTYESSVGSMNSNSKTERADLQATGDRFSRACALVQQYAKADTKKPIVDYAFDILNNVSMGNYTKWSIVYDISKRQILFKTEGHKQLKYVSLNSFNFSCKAAPQYINMNQDLTGDISHEFSHYSNETNNKFLKLAFEQSKSQITVSEELQDAIASIAAGVKCTNQVDHKQSTSQLNQPINPKAKWLLGFFVFFPLVLKKFYSRASHNK